MWMITVANMKSLTDRRPAVAMYQSRPCWLYELPVLKHVLFMPVVLTVTGYYANESLRQRPVRQRIIADHSVVNLSKLAALYCKNV